MPRPMRKRAGRTLTEAQRAELLGEGVRGLMCMYGEPGAPYPGTWGAFETEAERLVAWRAHRAELLAEWIAERPGTRPWTWWELDAPEPRKILEYVERPPQKPLGTGGYVNPREPYQPPLEERRLLFGVPHAWWDNLQVESEAAYLARHGFLTDAEREALDPDAFDPVWERKASVR